jgi:hypothetical protein
VKYFQPEIGQMIFGQPYKPFPVPEIMDAALEAIRHELQRVLWNLRQRQGGDPFGNEGASFRCEAFTVCSYSWNDDLAQPYNFKHAKSGTLISWYKYSGRGASADREITPDMAADILLDCLTACKAIEAGDMRWDEPGLYPDGHLEAADD